MASQYVRYPLLTTRIATYANAAALPVSATHGDVAITLDTDILYEYDGSTWDPIASNAAYTSALSATGTVTSVALLDASSTPIYAISGSPVTTSGTLTFTLGTQSANRLFAGPSTGAAAQPTFRALAYADLPAIPSSVVLWVDKARADSYTQTGTVNFPYKTIQGALSAIPAVAAAADVKIPYTLMIAPGSYDEDLTIPTGRIINLFGLGTVVLGDGLGANWSSTVPRSITWSVNSADVFGSDIKPALSIVTVGPADATSTFISESSNFTISGNLNVTGAGLTNTLNLYGVKVWGNLVHTTSALTNWQSYKSIVLGTVTTSGNLVLERAYDSRFNGLLSVNAVNMAANCNFPAGITVQTIQLNLLPNGFFHCNIAGTFTGVANSARFDSITNKFFVSNAAALAGGATKVYLDDVIGINYTPTTSANWNTVPTSGLLALDSLAGSGIVKSQTQNLVLASPSGSSGVPSFRALVSGDLPAISPGGITLTQNHILVGSASNVGADVAMSGDATIVASGVLTLATVNANVGSFGSSTAIPNFTVNAKGLITAAGTSVVIAPAGTLTGTTLAANVVTSSLTSVGTITSGVWNGTAITVANGGTGRTSLTDHGVLVGAGTGAVTQLSAAVAGSVLTGQGASSDPAFSSTPTLGIAGTTKGTLSLAGNTSGVITIQPQAAAGTFNFNLPVTAGSSGEVLTSQGGGATAMTWSSVGSGTVTSVDFADASTTPIYAVSGNPVTTSGTLTVTLNTQTASTVFAGPTSGGAAQPSFIPTANILALLRTSISGLGMANGSDANNDIDISTGCVIDTTFATLMTLGSAITKQLDASWAVGTNQGGLDTGSKASNTWYWVYIIQRSDTGVVDALFSTSASSPTMPTNYDRKRRIGAIKTNGSSNLYGFVQNGNDFWWKVPPNDLTSSSISTATTTFTVSVPPMMVLAYVNTSGGKVAATPFISFKSPFQTSYNANAQMQPSVAGGNGFATFNMETDSTGQLDVKASEAGVTVGVDTNGYLLNRELL